SGDADADEGDGVPAIVVVDPVGTVRLVVDRAPASSGGVEGFTDPIAVVDVLLDTIGGDGERGDATEPGRSTSGPMSAAPGPPVLDRSGRRDPVITPLRRTSGPGTIPKIQRLVDDDGLPVFVTTDIPTFEVARAATWATLN